MIRSWMAHVLRGDRPEWIFDGDHYPADIVAAAQMEGIAALLHDRFSNPALVDTIPSILRQQLGKAAQTKAAQSLFRAHNCRQILAQLERMAIPALLLKGSALAYWAYSSPHLRECSDIDLLLRSRADIDRVGSALEHLQFEPRERFLPGDLVSFEMTWVGIGSTNAGLEVDLHWQLSSAPFFAYRFTWEELYSTSIPLPSLAANARGIAPLPAYVHACMHRMQNIANSQRDTLKWLYDLVALGEQFEPADWDNLVRMTIERGLAGTCADGIRASTHCFGDIAPKTVVARLTEAARQESMDVRQMHRWWYVQRMNWLAFPSTRQRFRWLRQRLFPDLKYMRVRYGSEGGLLRSAVSRSMAAFGRMRR